MFPRSKSSYILQPGPAALSEGVRHLHAILARVAGCEPESGLEPAEAMDVDFAMNVDFVGKEAEA